MKRYTISPGYISVLVIGLLVLLAACDLTTPVQPIPSPQRASPSAVALAPSVTPTFAPPNVPTTNPLPPTSLPVTPTTTPQPSPTLTPQPTLTAQPTPTTAPRAAAVITISRPLPLEFVATPVPVSGSIANAPGGTVLLSLRTPDGQPIGPAPVAAETSVVSDSLQFRGEITLELPPTPREAVAIVQFGPAVAGQSVVEAGQLVNLPGRFGKIDQLLVEEPRPRERPGSPTLVVSGIAPGPPARVLARLLDSADQVVESVETTLGWYQPGLPCSFNGTLPNNPAGTQLQVLTLGDDDAVTAEVRFRLDP